MSSPTDHRPSIQPASSSELARSGLSLGVQALIKRARERVAGISDISGEVLARHAAERHRARLAVDASRDPPAAGKGLDAHEVRIAKRTNRQYGLVYKRFMNWDPADNRLVGDASCSATRRAYAAAVRAMIKRHVENACADLVANPTAEPDFLHGLGDCICLGLAALQRLEKELDRWRAAQAQGASRRGGRRRSSRKAGLLPWGEDAADRLWAAAAGAPSLRFIDVIALLLLAGVRPTEIEQGVSVRHWTDDKGMWLQLTIKGGKCKAAAQTPPDESGEKATVSVGQESRTLTFKVNSAFARHLARQVELNAGADIEVQAPAKAVCDAFRRVAKRAFPRHGNRPSAYHCRHEFAAEIKTDGDADMVGRALGHASAATQQRYGNRRVKRRKPDRLIEAKASAPVRASTKTLPMPDEAKARLQGAASATPSSSPVPVAPAQAPVLSVPRPPASEVPWTAPRMQAERVPRSLPKPAPAPRPRP